MQVKLIAAVTQNGVIGRNNDLPWNLPDDMAHFSRTTRGHVVITGRRNFDAMGAPLPGRRTLVVSRSLGVGQHPAVGKSAAYWVFPEFEQALAQAGVWGVSEVYVIGGAEIYALALPWAHAYYRTRILADIAGDVYFPKFDETEWRCTALSRWEAEGRNEHAFVIELLERVGSPPCVWKAE
jgi:dihydrofolate reductase